MSYQAMRKHGGTPNAYYYVREANLKSLHRMISITLHSGKVKAMETVVVRGWIRGVWDEQVECRGFLKIFSLFPQEKEKRKRGRETSMCGCLSVTPHWGPSPKPRHVPWLGTEPVTIWFAGPCSIHWARPARAEHRGFLRQWKYFVWYYNGRYMPLYIFLSP